MRREGKLLRTLVLCVIGAIVILAARFGVDPLAFIAVRKALRNIDPGASVGSVQVTGRLAVLRDLELPEKGLILENAVVYWSGSPFRPSLDSMLVGGGEWEPVRFPVSGPGSDSRASTCIPPCRFAGIRILNGNDTSLVCGEISGTADGRIASLRMESDWGELMGTVLMEDGRDSACIDWFSCSRVPCDILPVPELLRDLRLQGAMTAVRTDHLVARGEISSVNGAPSEISFTLDDSPGYPAISISSRLETLREVLISQTRELLGDVYIDMEPSGFFTVELMDSDTLGVVVDALLEGIRIYFPGLSEDTVSFTASVDLKGFACMGTRAVRVDSGVVRIGDLPIGFDLRGWFTDRPRLEMNTWNHSFRGEALSGSVPTGLLGVLSGLELSGEGSFEIGVVLDWDCPDSSDFHADIDVSRLQVDRSPVSVGQLRYGGSCCMRDSWGGSRIIYLDTLENPGFIVFDSLHPSFEGLLRCAEDATFRAHDGFCEYHIRNSIRANMRSGRFVRGGSTITMQLARNLFLNREKTLARKVQEIFLTWRLESYLSKNRILEIYANIVELGPGVFGFDQAARYYFGRDLDQLSTREVAYLVSILPGPRLYHGFYTRGRVPDYWEDYIDRLIRISSERGWIDADSAGRAESASIVFTPAGGAF
ncbi:MAG: transglycosylase domain-containing protein [Candidatus Fermentibacteraceae bacterium]|nr:transglycosylase domain-containing protein [Candidatus Fermentibacteraceae bacterium]MBN2608754.1 transglycosylase domain-containing protein [Candidatus Fermentibacteraceae bacterium]